MIHGSPWTYTNHCCRCRLCTEAHTNYQRKQRLLRVEREVPAHIHGKDSTYRGWACRCEACTEAHRLAAARYYARVKAARGGSSST